MLGTTRYETRINRPAAQVWELAGAAERLCEWFPGIVASPVDGTNRVITMAAGMSMPEEIIYCDNTIRSSTESRCRSSNITAARSM